MEPSTAICLHSVRVAQDMAEVIAVSLQTPFPLWKERLKPLRFSASCLSCSTGAQMATFAKGSFILQLFGFDCQCYLFCNIASLYDSSMGKGFLYSIRRGNNTSWIQLPYFQGKTISRHMKENELFVPQTRKRFRPIKKHFDRVDTKSRRGKQGNVKFHILITTVEKTNST